MALVVLFGPLGFLKKAEGMIKPARQSAYLPTKIRRGMDTRKEGAGESLNSFNLLIKKGVAVHTATHFFVSE